MRANVQGNMRESPQVRLNLAGYYGLCTSLDHELSRVLGKLSDLGLAEDTLVVFTADHGDMHASHALYFKGKPQEESVHVPDRAAARELLSEVLRPGDVVLVKASRSYGLELLAADLLAPGALPDGDAA